MKPSDARTDGELLSPREHAVLSLLAWGYTNRQAAEWLVLSVKTIETYRTRMMEKLRLADRHALIRYALEHGILRPGKEPSHV